MYVLLDDLMLILNKLVHWKYTLLQEVFTQASNDMMEKKRALQSFFEISDGTVVCRKVNDYSTAIYVEVLCQLKYFFLYFTIKL